MANGVEKGVKGVDAARDSEQRSEGGEKCERRRGLQSPSGCPAARHGDDHPRLRSRFDILTTPARSGLPDHSMLIRHNNLAPYTPAHLRSPVEHSKAHTTDSRSGFSSHKNTESWIQPRADVRMVYCTNYTCSRTLFAQTCLAFPIAKGLSKLLHRSNVGIVGPLCELRVVYCLQAS